MLGDEEVNERASSEDKYLALTQWWQRHNKIFNEWFLSLSTESQAIVLLKGSPDLPLKSSSIRSKDAVGGPLKPTDLILPELSQEALLAAGGKILVLLLTRRLQPADTCFRQDVLFLHQVKKDFGLPDFSNGNLSKFELPFVDPLDPDESIRSMASEATPEQRAQIQAHFDSGRLVQADAWLALKLRRTALVSFMENIVEEFEVQVPDKPIPLFKELLRGELEQQMAMEAQLATMSERDEVARDEIEPGNTTDRKILSVPTHTPSGATQHQAAGDDGGDGQSGSEALPELDELEELS